MPKQTVDFCTERDLPELFERFADWYRFNPRMQERDYFDWQFKHAPTRLADAEYDFLILRENGRIAGCLGFTGFEFELDGRTATGGWTHNWYAPEQRDGGLALLMRFMELVDNRFIIRFNDNTARVFSLLKVPMILALPRWWAAINPEACLRVFKRNEQDLPIFSQSANALKALGSADSVQSVERFDSSESFSLSHLGEDIAHAKRDGRYLNWRYFDAPKHQYHAIRHIGQFGIFRIEPVMGTELSVIRILEWTFGADAAPRALSWIMSSTGSRAPILIDFHCSCERLGHAIECYGFVRQDATQNPMPDLFRPSNYSGGTAVAIDLPPHRTVRHIDFSKWYITIGDSDVDRVKL